MKTTYSFILNREYSTRGKDIQVAKDLDDLLAYVPTWRSEGGDTRTMEGIFQSLNVGDRFNLVQDAKIPCLSVTCEIIEVKQHVKPSVGLEDHQTITYKVVYSNTSDGGESCL